MRNQNFNISSVPLHLSTSSGSPHEFSYVSPGSQISCGAAELFDVLGLVVSLLSMSIIHVSDIFLVGF